MRLVTHNICHQVDQAIAVGRLNSRQAWNGDFRSTQGLSVDRNWDLRDLIIARLTFVFLQKSWDVALAPWKQVPMNLFIMYMAGNSISIFPIMMVGMLFLRPVKALLTIQSTFKMIAGGQAILQKIVYLFGNLACLALALYKCSSMGLLPTHASDWLDFVEPRQRIEYSGGGIILSWARNVSQNDWSKLQAKLWSPDTVSVLYCPSSFALLSRQ